MLAARTRPSGPAALSALLPSSSSSTRLSFTSTYMLHAGIPDAPLGQCYFLLQYHFLFTVPGSRTLWLTHSQMQLLVNSAVYTATRSLDEGKLALQNDIFVLALITGSH